MPKKSHIPERPYAKLCATIEARGGKIRLGRSGDAFMLVVEDPTHGGSPRVAGYAFHDIAELDPHSLLIMKWLRRRDGRLQKGNGVPGI